MSDLTGDKIVNHKDLTRILKKWNVDYNDETLTEFLNNWGIDDTETFDYVVVGGGPSGIMAAYKLAIEQPNKSVALLEKNTFTLDNYINDGYNDMFRWFQAQSNPKYQYAFLSNDNKSVWMGKGLGGGTLHFGLQYIDTNDLINYNYEEWLNDNGY